MSNNKKRKSKKDRLARIEKARKANEPKNVRVKKTKPTPKKDRHYKCGCVKYHDGKKYVVKIKCDTINCHAKDNKKTKSKKARQAAGKGKV